MQACWVVRRPSVVRFLSGCQFCVDTYSNGTHTKNIIGKCDTQQCGPVWNIFEGQSSPTFFAYVLLACLVGVIPT